MAREYAVGLDRPALVKTLTATSRFSARSWARKTMPMPPWPTVGVAPKRGSDAARTNAKAKGKAKAKPSPPRKAKPSLPPEQPPAVSPAAAASAASEEPPAKKGRRLDRRDTAAQVERLICQRPSTQLSLPAINGTVHARGEAVRGYLAKAIRDRRNSSRHLSSRFWAEFHAEFSLAAEETVKKRRSHTR